MLQSNCIEYTIKASAASGQSIQGESGKAYQKFKLRLKRGVGANHIKRNHSRNISKQKTCVKIPRWQRKMSAGM